MKALLISIILSIFGFASLNVQSQDLTKGLVHHYLFDGDLNDTSSNSNTLKNYGSTSTSDRYGNSNSARHFTGGQHLTGSTSQLPVKKTARTTSIWLYLDLVPDSDVPFCYGSQGKSQGYGIALGTNLDFKGQNAFRHFGWGDDVPIRYNYPIKKWFHVVTTYDGDTAKLFVNGKRISASYRNWSTASELFFVGKNLNSNPNDDFEGSIDDFRIYDRVLSTQEISLLYNQPSSGISSLEKPSFTISPNPSNGIFNLNIESNKIEKVMVLDKLGRLVKNNGSSNLIDLTNNKGGLYFVKIIDRNNTIDIRRIVKI